MLLSDAAAGRSTGPAQIVSVLGTTGSAIALLIASAIAIAALMKNPQDWTMAVALLPQQLLLYAAAWGGLQAVVDGQYADGVERAYEFILTDQLPMMLLA